MKLTLAFIGFAALLVGAVLCGHFAWEPVAAAITAPGPVA
jgi:hypothetical protein